MDPSTFLRSAEPTAAVVEATVGAGGSSAVLTTSITRGGRMNECEDGPSSVALSSDTKSASLSDESMSADG